MRVKGPRATPVIQASGRVKFEDGLRIDGQSDATNRPQMVHTLPGINSYFLSTAHQTISRLYFMNS